MTRAMDLHAITLDRQVPLDEGGRYGEPILVAHALTTLSIIKGMY